MEVCRTELKKGADRLVIGQHGDPIVYGNSHGMMLLEELAELRRDVTVLISNVHTLKSKDSRRDTEKMERDIEKKETDEEIEALKSKVDQLSEYSNDYKIIRKRCVAFYLRDYKGKKDPKVLEAIKGGNYKAHAGDAVADAIVFEEDGSLDPTVYEELYGLAHTKVIEWSGTCGVVFLLQGLTNYIVSEVEDGGLFRALNLHASSVLQGKMSPEVSKVFGSFVTQVKRHWLEPPNKKPNTALYSSFYTFLSKHKELQKSIRDKSSQQM